MLRTVSMPDNEVERHTEELIKRFYTKMGTNSVKTLDLAHDQEDTTECSLVKDSLLPEDSFIVSTPYGQRITDDLSCVGEEFLDLNYRASVESVKLMVDQELLTRPNTEIVVVHLLRAGKHYRITEALKTVLPHEKIHEVYIRPRYTYKSYRKHRLNGKVDTGIEVEEDPKKKEVEIIYQNWDSLPENKRLTLVFADSIASAETIKKSLPTTLDAVFGNGNTVENIIQEGLISKNGSVILKNVVEVEEKERSSELELSLFALEDFSDMSVNNYDMPLWGLDPALIEKGDKKLCGNLTIISREGLKRHILTYTPGNDQLGDYSERGVILYATIDQTELPDVIKHLINSIKMTRLLYGASQDESWYIPSFQNRIFEAHLASLGRQFGRKIVGVPEFRKGGCYNVDLHNVKELVRKESIEHEVAEDLASKLERYAALGLCEDYTGKWQEPDGSYGLWSFDGKI